MRRKHDPVRNRINRLDGGGSGITRSPNGNVQGRDTGRLLNDPSEYPGTIVTRYVRGRDARCA
jgi:hypothetical protein